MIKKVTSRICPSCQGLMELRQTNNSGEMFFCIECEYAIDAERY